MYYTSNSTTSPEVARQAKLIRAAFNEHRVHYALQGEYAIAVSKKRPSERTQYYLDFIRDASSLHPSVFDDISEDAWFIPLDQNVIDYFDHIGYTDLAALADELLKDGKTQLIITRFDDDDLLVKHVRPEQPSMLDLLDELQQAYDGRRDDSFELAMHDLKKWFADAEGDDDKDFA